MVCRTCLYSVKVLFQFTPSLWYELSPLCAHESHTDDPIFEVNNGRTSSSQTNASGDNELIGITRSKAHISSFAPPTDFGGSPRIIKVTME